MREQPGAGSVAVDIGTINVYEFDDGWQATICLGDVSDPSEEYDLAFHPSAGDAVNEAMKWARDRKLILTWPSMTIRSKP